MNTNQTIIFVIFAAYLILNAVIGIVFGRKQSAAGGLSEEKKYFIGGRSMGGLVLAMTTMATYTSVSSFVSGPGAAGLTYGYAQVWVAAVQVPVTFLVLGVLGNKLAIVSRRTGSVTIVGYLRARYKNDALVIITSVLMVAFFIAQMISQFTGGATLISSITGLDHKWALLIFGLVVIAYTAFGGFSAVAITDTLQGIIMCIGTFLFLFFVLKKGGGLAGIDAGLQANLPGYDDLFSKYAPGGLLSYWILVGFGTLGLPQTAVRAMGFKDTKSLHKAMWIGALTCSFVMVGMHLAGCWAGALVNTAELPTSDYFVPYIVQQIMPVGVAGIFLAAPMAAVMSTVDSILILSCAAIVRDLWKTYIVKDDPAKLKSYENNVKKVSAVITLVLGVITMLLTIDPPQIIFFLNMFAFGGLECTFFWPILGGLFWKKGNAPAALSGSVVSTAVYILYTYSGKSVWGLNGVVFGLLFGGIAYFAVGTLTSRTHPVDGEILDRCF